MPVHLSSASRYTAKGVGKLIITHACCWFSKRGYKRHIEEIVNLDFLRINASYTLKYVREG